jgi:hypothetical protein
MNELELSVGTGFARLMTWRSREMRRIIRSAFGLLLGAALLVAALAVGSTPALAQFEGPTPLTLVNLTLVNGCTNAPFNTSNAAVEKINGIVHFKGAVANGTNAVMITLPAGFRPLTDVYVPVDLCNATNGRIHIVPSGVVNVEAEGGNFNNAQCFTSLDGASFVR